MMLQSLIKDKNRIYLLTNAPSAYDYRWVRREADNVATNNQDTYRLVSADKKDEYMLSTQEARYQSGLFVVYRLPGQFKDWERAKKTNRIQETPQKMVIHRYFLIKAQTEEELLFWDEHLHRLAKTTKTSVQAEISEQTEEKVMNVWVYGLADNVKEFMRLYRDTKRQLEKCGSLQEYLKEQNILVPGVDSGGNLC